MNKEFINFPENVEKFTGTMTHTIQTHVAENITWQQNNEIDMVIKLKYLLAFSESVEQICKGMDMESASELRYNVSKLIELCNNMSIITVEHDTFFDKPSTEVKPLIIDFEETWFEI